MPTCSIPNCPRPRWALGLCNTHYALKRRVGNPSLRARPHYGYPLEWLGQQSGYTEEPCLIWPFGRNKDGYGLINCGGQTRRAHVVMCEITQGKAPSDRHQVAHSCGNGHGGCVAPTHLRWATPAENYADRRGHGTDNVGSRNGRVRLNESSVLYLRQSFANGSTVTELARELSVPRNTVDSVVKRISWRHLP